MEDGLKMHHVGVVAMGNLSLNPKILSSEDDLDAYLLRLPEDEARSYTAVKQALLKRDNLTEEGFRAKFRQNKAEEGESPRQFIVRLPSYLERWVELAESSKSYEGLRDLFVKEQFLKACPRDLAVRLREQGPSSLDELSGMAQHYLEAHERELGKKEEEKGKKTIPVRNRTQLGTTSGIATCYTCGDPSHFARDCPMSKQESRFTGARSFFGGKNIRSPQTAFDVRGQVEGKTVPLLLDTGSAQTLIREDLVDPTKIAHGDQGGITCVHGDERKYPTAQVEIRVGRQSYRVNAKVTPNLPRPAIVGRDVPHLAELVQQCASGRLAFVTTRAQARKTAQEFIDLQKAMQQSGVQLRQFSRSAAEPTEDPIEDWGRFSGDLFYNNGKARKSKKQRRADKRRGASDHGHGELEPLDGEDPTLGKVRDLLHQGDGSGDSAMRYVAEGGMMYRLWKPKGEDEDRKQLVLPQQCRPVVLQLAHDATMAGHLGRKKTAERIRREFFWPGLYADCARRRQRQQLNDLLHEFADIFQDTPGRTNLAEHRIDTGSSKPVRQRAYRVAQAHREKMRGELDKMEEMGVIEPSNSEWASPVVLVPKKDGSIRFCVDFRKVNAVSRFDAYPMPRIDEMLDKLGKAKYITKIDLSRGYWQVPLTPDSKSKTAFATPFGLYQFHTMPFGLHGAPATFQRLMDNMLRGTEEFADSYIDDLDIFSEWDEHLLHLREIFTRLRNARLTVKPSKCHFAMKVVPLLGYVAGGGRIRPDEDKVRAVKEFPRPTSKKEPQVVEWTDECEGAFQTLKGKLCEDPVLRSPDFERPFVLQTDASDRGIGAVLSQVDENGEEHPVVYTSRKLLLREQNYSVPEKECLAIKYTVEGLRYYLLGREFEVVTDHHPLKWLNEMKDKNQRLTRWSLCLQPYRFVVTHRAGKANANADALSRA
ncbi:hypothetical protein Bbelb_254740 [Branchiostoma belcheri]|nr:hypothetical protein Bbelb_254740 [Branchiostoma belcheri]